MALIRAYLPGATPLSPEELHGLIPSFVTTQSALNEFEQANILHGVVWATNSRQDILTEKFVIDVHTHLFGETWKWAGIYRTSDKNSGYPYWDVPMRVESNTWLPCVRQIIGTLAHCCNLLGHSCIKR